MNHTVRKESELMGLLGEYCPQAIAEVGRVHPESQRKMRLLGKLLDVVVKQKRLTLEPDLFPHSRFLATLGNLDQSSIAIFKPSWSTYPDPDILQSKLIFRIGSKYRKEAEDILNKYPLEESELTATIDVLRKSPIYLRCGVQTALSFVKNGELVFMSQPALLFDWYTGIPHPSIAFWQRGHDPYYQDLKRLPCPVTIENFLTIYKGISTLECYVRNKREVEVGRHRTTRNNPRSYKW